MSIFDFYMQLDINAGAAEYEVAENAVLLDVRTPQEYREGHIPGSLNVPLQAIEGVASVVENKETPLFVYCYSGNRSRQATTFLQHMGYRNEKNIGAIAAYSGNQEH